MRLRVNGGDQEAKMKLHILLSCLVFILVVIATARVIITDKMWRKLPANIRTGEELERSRLAWKK
jgi:hypothetical protein